MSRANKRQVGGSHYKTKTGLQHWDVVTMFNLDYFQGNITKYLFRWREKNGLEDLYKAQHYLEKYIEEQEAEHLSDMEREHREAIRSAVQNDH